MEIDFIGKRHSESFFSTSSLILQFFFLYNWLNLYYIVAQVVSCCLDSFFHRAFNWSLPACLHDPLNPQCCSSHSKYFKSSSFLHEFEWKKNILFYRAGMLCSLSIFYFYFFFVDGPLITIIILITYIFNSYFHSIRSSSCF